MTATTTTATYNFDELYAKVFDSSPERVANTEQPTVQGVLRYLSDKLDGKRFVRSHKPNERALYNAGIIIDEPLAPGTKRGRYAQWFRQCTPNAKRFYLDLRLKVNGDAIAERKATRARAQPDSAITYDEFSAEWLNYLEADKVRAAAKVAERRFVEDALYQDDAADRAAQREMVML